MELILQLQQKSAGQWKKGLDLFKNIKKQACLIVFR
jgi:hypothetical protein